MACQSTKNAFNDQNCVCWTQCERTNSLQEYAYVEFGILDIDLSRPFDKNVQHLHFYIFIY